MDKLEALILQNSNKKNLKEIEIFYPANYILADQNLFYSSFYDTSPAISFSRAMEK